MSSGPAREQAPSHVTAFEYGAWLVANLTLTERPREHGFPLAWDSVDLRKPVARLRRGNPPAGTRSRPDGIHLLLSAVRRRPAQARTRLLGMDWQTCAEVVLTDLTRSHPDIRSLVEHWT